MLYYDSFGSREVTDVAKSNNNKKFIICRHWFLNREFKFQISVSNGCQNLTMLCL